MMRWHWLCTDIQFSLSLADNLQHKHHQNGGVKLFLRRCSSVDFLLLNLKLDAFLKSRCRSRGGVPPLHAAVPRGAAPRGAPLSRAPSSRGRGVQRARGAPPTAGYRPAPPIVQDSYGEYVSILCRKDARRNWKSVRVGLICVGAKWCRWGN